MSYLVRSKLVSCLLYILFLSGLGTLFSGQFEYIARRFTLRHRLRKPAEKTNPVFEYLERLVLASTGREVKGGAAAAILVTLFLIVFLMTRSSFSFAASLLVSLLTASAPLLLLLVKLESGRSRGSKEGISFVTELNRQYRIHNRNIYEALAAVCRADGDYPICRRNAYTLLIHLRAASDPGEIRRSIDKFAFSLDTGWGNLLANCIRMSAEKGTDISAGLEDIILQLKTAFARSEERRRLNSESSRMTLFFAPLLYIITINLAVKHFGMTFSEFLHNQFMTPEGLLFFTIIIFLFLANLVFISLVAGSKLDY